MEKYNTKMDIRFDNIGYFYKENKNNVIYNLVMAESVKLRLKGNLSFDVDVDGHSMVIDSAPDFGGESAGPKPKSLMLVALGGCTAMDIVSILRKMKIQFEDVNIEVQGNLTETHPRHFDHMHIIYRIKGRDISREKVQMAVDLSQEKYCGVSYSYRSSIKITSEIIIEE